MLIRKARSNEAPTIQAFQLAMALETENLQLHEATVGLGVKAIFDDPTKGNYYVAEVDGQLVSSLLTTFEWSDWRNGTVLWVQSVYVRPEFRQRGIYSAMYKYVQQQVLANEQLKGIRLYAEKTNRTAQLVYEKTGMNAEHYTLYEWLKFD
ncbi:MAG: GNAT family N-acetyltransferase [Mangrovibacterium sp.]